MRLIEVTSRHRNDFHWVGQCESCGHKEGYGDGYADHFYCTRVVPGRHCSKCGLNSYGEKVDAQPASAAIAKATSPSASIGGE